jgi:hypothetical protein
MRHDTKQDRRRHDEIAARQRRELERHGWHVVCNELWDEGEEGHDSDTRWTTTRGHDPADPNTEIEQQTRHTDEHTETHTHTPEGTTHNHPPTATPTPEEARRAAKS